MVCKYSTRPIDSPHTQETLGQTGASPAEAKNDNPLLRPAKIGFGGNRVRKVVERDRNDKLIANSAGYKFDPPLEVEITRLTIHVSRAEAAFDPTVIVAYQDRVNKTPWYGFAKNWVKCNKIAAERQYEAGVFYWDVSYEFEVDTLEWADALLDAGFIQNYTDAMSVKHNDPCLVGGRAAPYPVPLDGKGKQLDLTDPLNVPQYLVFYTKLEADFNLLGLV